MAIEEAVYAFGDWGFGAARIWEQSKMAAKRREKVAPPHLK